MSDTSRSNSLLRLIWAARLSVLALMIAVAVALDAASTSSHLNDVRQRWQAEADDISLKLRGQILQNVQAVWGLAANVAVEPTIDDARFENLASTIFTLAPELRNIGLAPDFVIRFMYPMEGNEAALGLDLTKQSLPPGEIQAMLDSRQVRFTGPINLVQGGQGLAARLPIFERASDRLWGVVSVILDMDKLYQAAGISQAPADAQFALSKSADPSNREAVFYGSRSARWDNPITSTIAMPGANWTLLYQPRGGWPAHPANPWVFRSALVVLVLLFTGAAFWLTSLLFREDQARRRFSGLFELAPFGIGLFNATTGDLIRANHAFERSFGAAARSLAFFDRSFDRSGRPLTGAIGIRKELAKNGRFAGIEAYYQTASGALTPFQMQGLQLDDVDNEPVVWLITQDIAERKYIDQMKSEFISTVSHELRTPLTSISGSLGLLANNAVGTLPEKASKLAGIAYRNSQQLTFLINDLLDIESLIAGKMSFKMENQALEAMVRESVENIQPFARGRQVSLHLADLAPVTVHADKQRFHQALNNLLSNAIKFSPAGGTVEMFTQQTLGSVRLCVQDNGPGIPLSFRDRIFEKFSQADSSDQRSKGGTGLGLAITRELMVRMNGGVDYHSVPGQGATFWLELPIVAEAAEQHTG